MMTEMQFTDDELNVLQSILQFIDGDIPDSMDEDSYKSLFYKVMCN